MDLYVVTMRLRVRARDERHALGLANAAFWDDMTIHETKPGDEDLRDVFRAGDEPILPAEVRRATEDERRRRATNLARAGGQG